MNRRTPCIGVCSTTYGDRVCRGCKRFAHEIDSWNRYDDDQQSAVWARLNALRDACVREYVNVVDAERLIARAQELRVDPHNRSLETLAYELLRRSEYDLAASGLTPTALGTTAGPTRLFDALDREFFIRSRAHFERSFRAPA